MGWTSFPRASSAHLLTSCRKSPSRWSTGAVRRFLLGDIVQLRSGRRMSGGECRNRSFGITFVVVDNGCVWSEVESVSSDGPMHSHGLLTPAVRERELICVQAARGAEGSVTRPLGKGVGEEEHLRGLSMVPGRATAKNQVRIMNPDASSLSLHNIDPHLVCVYTHLHT